MDENDIYPEKGQPALRRIYRMEEGDFPSAVVRYVSIACMHCQDSPCAAACPSGALDMDAARRVLTVDREQCIGCRSCAAACPYNIPRYDRDEKMWICNLCMERVEAGLDPACVRVCPLGALKFDVINKEQAERQFQFVLKYREKVMSNI
jgi:Fe-S-cluster-containing dehydrogenase component